MKSTLSKPEKDKGQYSVKHFNAIADNGFRYFWSSTEGVMLYFNGEWVRYDDVRKSIPTLPEVTYEA